MAKSSGRRLRLGILWADPYSSNLGVAALAYSTIILFEEVSRRIGVQFDYTIWAASHCEHGVIDTGNKKIPIRTVRPFLGGHIATFIGRCLKNPLRFGTILFALDFLRYELIADIGAGDSYSDIYGITRFRNLDFTKWWSRKLHKKYILLPQTLGPFKSREARTKAKRSLNEADLIFARDKMSYDCAHEILSDKIVEQTIDTAFFLPYVRTECKCENIKIGINISGLLWHGGYTQDNQFGLKSNYQQTMRAILDYFSKKDGVEIHLISHVVGDQDPIDEDYHIVQKICNDYPQAIVSPPFQTPVEAKSYISMMDFFTGARMHACIAAISSGVPVYPLAYSRKFNGLFCETLEYSDIADLVCIDTKEIVQGLDKAFQQREKLKKNIAGINQRIIEPEKEKMIECLVNYLVKNEF